VAGPRNLNVRSNSGTAALQWWDIHYSARPSGKYTLVERPLDRWRPHGANSTARRSRRFATRETPRGLAVRSRFRPQLTYAAGFGLRP